MKGYTQSNKISWGEVSTKLTPRPKGVYAARFVKADADLTQDKKPCVTAVVEIVGQDDNDPGRKTTHYDTFTFADRGFFRPKQAAEALGINIEEICPSDSQEDREAFAQALVLAGEVWVRLIIDAKYDPDNPRNKIGAYLTPDEASKSRTNGSTTVSDDTALAVAPRRRRS